MKAVVTHLLILQRCRAQLSTFCSECQPNIFPSYFSFSRLMSPFISISSFYFSLKCAYFLLTSLWGLCFTFFYFPFFLFASFMAQTYSSLRSSHYHHLVHLLPDTRWGYGISFLLKHYNIENRLLGYPWCRTYRDSRLSSGSQLSYMRQLNIYETI